MKKLLTPNEAAELLRLSVYTLLEHARKGTIPAVKVGREWRFVEEDLDAWLAKNRTGGTGTYASDSGGYSLARDAVATEPLVARETAQDRFINEMIAERQRAWEEIRAFRDTIKPFDVRKMLEELDEEYEERIERLVNLAYKKGRE